MADEVKAVKGKSSKIFGVYQLEMGSYTLGEFRFPPCKAVACDAATKESACEETSPVKFFDTEEAANAEAARLKAKFELKRKPQAKEE